MDGRKVLAKQSFLSRILRYKIALSGVKNQFRRDRIHETLERNRGINESPELDVDQIRIKSIVRSEHIAGMTTYIVEQNTYISKDIILYLHGGGYTGRMCSQQWDFIDLLARSTQCKVMIPMYPLTPNVSHEVAFERLLSLYKSLMSEVEPSEITIIGDSAGGGLALAFSQYLSSMSIKGPCHIVLLSPWLDVSLKNPAVEAYEKKDPMLTIDGLRVIGKTWAGSKTIDHYKVSPINGSLDGLGQISLFIGTRDLLFPDCEVFYEKALLNGIHINYFTYPNMCHVWMIYTWLRESRDVISRITGLVKE